MFMNSMDDSSRRIDKPDGKAVKTQFLQLSHRHCQHFVHRSIIKINNNFANVKV